MCRLGKIFTTCLLIATVAGAFAQTPNNADMPDRLQPGALLHEKIKMMTNYGQPAPMAVNNVINSAVSNIDNTLSSNIKAVLAKDVMLAKQFYTTMLKHNSVINVTKTLVELNQDKTSHIITLGVTLYPNLANEVVDGAALSSSMSLEDIIIVAIQSGASLNRISLSVVHKSTIEPGPAVIPLGVGIGADGANNDDIEVLKN